MGGVPIPDLTRLYMETEWDRSEQRHMRTTLTEALAEMDRSGILYDRGWCINRKEAEKELTERAMCCLGRGIKVTGYTFITSKGWWKRKNGKDFTLHFGQIIHPSRGPVGSTPEQVGKIVCECLRQYGVDHSWDGDPTRPIRVITASIKPLPATSSTASRVIPPLTAGGGACDLADRFRVACLPDFEEYTFDMVGENPVRLLNVARLREQGLGHNVWHRPVKQPRIGDFVKLSFYVPDAPAPQPIPNANTEGMWVEVKHVQRSEAQPVYRGELRNEPVFIDNDKLSFGSMVSFTADHVFPPM